jgi:hypothetical protein
MTRKYAGWGGDAEIGLEEDDWTWRVPALLITLRDRSSPALTTDR